MTLGKKLSNYRKISGMTQQQLGDYLNLSAQAVSKWENDLAEPDLSTLKLLANLYKVSLDSLLDANTDTASAGKQVIDAMTVAESVSSAIDEKLKNAPQTIGFCKSCGIAVLEENLGTREPVVKCKKCVEAEKAEKIRAQEKLKEERRKAEEQKNLEIRRTKEALRAKRNKSLIVASIVTGIFIIAWVSSMTSAFTSDLLLGGLIIIYPVFAFVSMLFFDTPVVNVISYMCSASIKWPGLIFTWDLDGFIWLIGMKLLFAILGFFFGLACSILGIVIGICIAPFVFPYIMIRFHNDIKAGVVGDYVDVH